MLNEDRLRKEIEDTWGAFGAHAEIYSDLLSRLKKLETALKNCEVLVNEVFQETGDHRFMDASDTARELLENTVSMNQIELPIAAIGDN